jgi:perosamine synthetase
MAPAAIPLFKVFTAPTAHAALKPVLESGRLAAGPRVAEFEDQLAGWLDVPQCVALADASGALTLALYLAGVRPGSEVITSPMACSASLMPIANLFAKPVWCDVDPLTGMIEPDGISRLISKSTRAVLAYHWSGNVAEIGAITAVAKRHGLAVIEDASEAFGATAMDRRLGGEADFTVYSFYATKHINSGEGAALLAASPANLESALRLRRFGIDYSLFRLPNGDLNPEFDIPVAGYNLAMNEIAATLACEALRHAGDIVARHQANGAFYDSALADAPGVRLLRQCAGTRSAYWTYSLLAERRSDLIRKLTDHGIGAQRLHVRQDRYACFGGLQANLPGVAEFDAGNLSIPCGWWVGDAERERIAECIGAGW